MAAYAALVSLMNIMEQVQNHPRYSVSFDKKQIESLLKNVGYFIDFVEGYSHGGSKEAEVLERQIASAAYEVEDVVESHVVNQIHARSKFSGRTSSCFLPNLQKAIDDMDSIKEKAVKVKSERGFKDQLLMYPAPAASSTSLTIGKNNIVGFDDELVKLMDWLTGTQTNQLVIPIVGMGGIGKTTLSRNVYENAVIVHYFHVRAWVTISQNYNIRDILLELLSCQISQANTENLIAATNEKRQKTEDELGEQLYKSLSGRRYLVILDDIWSIEVWNELKLFFPDMNNGSQIVVTTRLSNVATHFGSLWLKMNFLDQDQSWKLFCEKIFAEGSCPRELMKVGMQIVQKCRDFPYQLL